VGRAGALRGSIRGPPPGCGRRAGSAPAGGAESVSRLTAFLHLSHCHAADSTFPAILNNRLIFSRYSEACFSKDGKRAERRFAGPRGQWAAVSLSGLVFVAVIALAPSPDAEDTVDFGTFAQQVVDESNLKMRSGLEAVTDRGRAVPLYFPEIEARTPQQLLAI